MPTTDVSAFKLTGAAWDIFAPSTVRAKCQPIEGGVIFASYRQEESSLTCSVGETELRCGEQMVSQD